MENDAGRACRTWGRRWLLAWVTVVCWMPAVRAEVLSACAADVEYPPYLFRPSTDSKDRTELAGVTLEVLRNAAPKLGGIRFAITRLPWLRCLKMAQMGQVVLVVNVPTAQIDPAPFLITRPYAQVHSIYFYSRRIRAAGVVIRDVQALRQFKLCGLQGYRYDSYGIDSAGVDTGAKSYMSLMRKLDAGYCDLVLDKKEVAQAVMARDPELAAFVESATIAQADLPEDSPLGLHFAVSRQFAGARDLAARLDDAVTEMVRKAQADAGRTRHNSPAKESQP